MMERERLIEELRKLVATLAAGRNSRAYADQLCDQVAAALSSPSREKVLEERIAAVRQIIEFGYRRVIDGRTVNPLKNGEPCDHGKREWEDCIGCYDEALLAAINPTESGNG